MFVQPEDIVVENVGKEDRTKLTLAKPMEIKGLAAEQHKIQIYKTAKRGLPSVRPEFDVKPQNTHHQLQRVRGTIHSLARLDNSGKQVLSENQTVGVFAGFHASIQNIPVKSKALLLFDTPKATKKICCL